MMKWMRTIVPAAILCLFMAGFAPVTAGAVPNNESVISLKAEMPSVSKGDAVKIKVSVRHAADLYGIQFRVKYDAAKLTLKEAAPTGGYNDFGGIKTDAHQGTVLLPLLREQASNLSQAAALDVAELSFTAREAGKAEVELLEIKAVSTESFINEAGLKDLKAIPVKDGGPLNITIRDSANPDVPSNPGTPSSPGAPADPGGPKGNEGNLAKSLKDIEQMLRQGRLKEAVSAASGLFSKEDPSLTGEKKKQWEALLKKLIEELQGSVTLGTDSADGAATIHESSLQFAVKSVTDLLSQSKKHGLQTEAGALIRLSLTSKAQQADVLHMTAEQLALLEKSGMSLVLEWALGTAKVHPDSLPKKNAVRISLASLEPSSVKDFGDKLKPLASYNLSVSEVTGGRSVPVAQLPGNLDLVLPFKAKGEGLHRLGVYRWDESSGSWKYMRDAKQKNGMYELGVNKPGIYSVMEYVTGYRDTGKLYNEAKHAIEALAAKQIMFGTGQGTFSPNQEITRAEFTSLLARAMNLEVSEWAENVFSDVKPEAWYSKEVHAASKAGIIQGDGRSFRPDEKLTREQMAVMLMNAAGSEAKEAAPADGSKFRDDDQMSSWAKEAIYAARENGLIKGKAQQLYSPKAYTSRAEAAIILLRWLDQR